MRITLRELKGIIKEEVRRMRIRENRGSSMKVLDGMCNANPDVAESFQDLYDSAKEGFMKGEISSFEDFKAFLPADLAPGVSGFEFVEELKSLYGAMNNEFGVGKDTAVYGDVKSGVQVAGPERWARSTAYGLNVPLDQIPPLRRR